MQFTDGFENCAQGCAGWQFVLGVPEVSCLSWYAACLNNHFVRPEIPQAVWILVCRCDAGRRAEAAPYERRMRGERLQAGRLRSISHRPPSPPSPARGEGGGGVGCACAPIAGWCASAPYVSGERLQAWRRDRFFWHDMAVDRVIVTSAGSITRSADGQCNGGERAATGMDRGADAGRTVWNALLTYIKLFCAKLT